MTTEKWILDKRLSLCEMTRSDAVKKAILTVDDQTVLKMEKAWENALHDLIEPHEVITLEIQNDPMQVLFNERW